MTIRAPGKRSVFRCPSCHSNTRYYYINEKMQVAELGYEVAASNGAFLLDSGKIRLEGGAFQGDFTGVRLLPVALNASAPLNQK